MQWHMLSWGFKTSVLFSKWKTNVSTDFLGGHRAAAPRRKHPRCLATPFLSSISTSQQNTWHGATDHWRVALNLGDRACWCKWPLTPSVLIFANHIPSNQATVAEKVIFNIHWGYARSCRLSNAASLFFLEKLHEIGTRFVSILQTRK